MVMKTREGQQGVTLTELLMVVAIIGAVFLLSRTGIEVFNSALFQNKTLQTQRDGQILLYQITKDIRDSKKIESVDFDRLVLHSFNVRDNGYSPDVLLNVIEISTITYQFQEQNGQVFLERVVENSVPTPRSTRTKFLTNVVLKPDAEAYLFKGGPDTLPPFDTVEVILRMEGARQNDKNIEYRQEVMKRAGFL